MIPVGLRAASSVDGKIVRNDLGVNVALADAPGDQLRVLGPVVDHQNLRCGLHNSAYRGLLGSLRFAGFDDDAQVVVVRCDLWALEADFLAHALCLFREVIGHLE